MQQEWDDLDRVIEESFENVKISDSYNYKLMAKMKKKKQKQVKNQSYTFAFSLILAGFLIMFIYTSDIQYKFIDIQSRIKTDITMLQSNINIFYILKGE